jgi:hypothetical protein
MSGTVLLAIIFLMLLGAFPAWPHSKNWGYRPAIGMGVALAVILCLVMMGKI